MLYRSITGGELLATNTWIETGLTSDRESEVSMTRIWSIIRMIRNLRAESGIKPGESRDVILVVPKIYRESIEANVSLMTGLARIATLTLEERSIK